MRRREDIALTSFYTNIDVLPEAVLDAMADGMGLSWWDTDYGLEAKRKLMKKAGAIQKREGTHWAVEEVLKAVVDESAKVHYWYDDMTIPKMRFMVTFSPEVEISEEEIKKIVERVRRAGMTFEGVAAAAQVLLPEIKETLVTEISDINGAAVWNGEFNMDGEIYFDSEAEFYE